MHRKKNNFVLFLILFPTLFILKLRNLKLFISILRNNYSNFTSILLLSEYKFEPTLKLKRVSLKKLFIMTFTGSSSPFTYRYIFFHIKELFLGVPMFFAQFHFIVHTMIIIILIVEVIFLNTMRASFLRLLSFSFIHSFIILFFVAVLLLLLMPLRNI